MGNATKTLPLFQSNGDFVSYSFTEYLNKKYAEQDVHVYFGFVRYIAKWNLEKQKHVLRLLEEADVAQIPEIRVKFGPQKLLLTQG